MLFQTRGFGASMRRRPRAAPRAPRRRGPGPSGPGRGWRAAAPSPGRSSAARAKRCSAPRGRRDPAAPCPRSSSVAGCSPLASMARSTLSHDASSWPDWCSASARRCHTSPRCGFAVEERRVGRDRLGEVAAAMTLLREPAADRRSRASRARHPRGAAASRGRSRASRPSPRTRSRRCRRAAGPRDRARAGAACTCRAAARARRSGSRRRTR